jgi:hypothetical protein
VKDVGFRALRPPILATEWPAATAPHRPLRHGSQWGAGRRGQRGARAGIAEARLLAGDGLATTVRSSRRSRDVNGASHRCGRLASPSRTARSRGHAPHDGRTRPAAAASATAGTPRLLVCPSARGSADCWGETRVVLIVPQVPDALVGGLACDLLLARGKPRVLRRNGSATLLTGSSSHSYG